MTVIAGSTVRSCLGDGAETFAGLLRQRCGVAALDAALARRTAVLAGYPIGGGDPSAPFRCDEWLADCVRETLEQARVDATRSRVVTLVGTGLGQLAAVEAWATGATGATGTTGATGQAPVDVEALHFAGVLRGVAGLSDIRTLNNACSAAGSALALGQDMLELGVADAVVVAGVDSMTASMLAMIGKVGDEPTDRVRPFDRDRRGVLLGEGVCAVVLVAEPHSGPVLGRLLATGMSCDAGLETAPDVGGIRRSMLDAHRRAGVRPRDIDLVVAHGTGTALNDPVESAALRAVFGDAVATTRVTALKGALGHTSGGSALLGVDVALRCMAEGRVPPIVGLENRIEEAAELRLVHTAEQDCTVRVAQVNAFGFGGVNAVTLVAAA